MVETSMSDEALLTRLSAHPALRCGIEALVLAVEDEAGHLPTGDSDDSR